MQQIGGGAVALKLLYNVNFTELGRIGTVKPGQKPHHRRAIAQMRSPAALQFLCASLQAFGRLQGSTPHKIFAGPADSASKAACGKEAGSIRTVPVRSLSCPGEGVPRGKRDSFRQNQICKFHFIAKEC